MTLGTEGTAGYFFTWCKVSKVPTSVFILEGFEDNQLNEPTFVDDHVPVWRGIDSFVLLDAHQDTSDWTRICFLSGTLLVKTYDLIEINSCIQLNTSSTFA